MQIFTKNRFNLQPEKLKKTPILGLFLGGISIFAILTHKTQFNHLETTLTFKSILCLAFRAENSRKAPYYL